MHISFFGAFVAAWFIGWLWRSRHNELLAAIQECRPPSRTRLMFEEYVRAGMTEAYDRGYEAPTRRGTRLLARSDLQRYPRHRQAGSARQQAGPLVDAHPDRRPLARERQPSSYKPGKFSDRWLLGPKPPWPTTPLG
jgi:hypothetical protein